MINFRLGINAQSEIFAASSADELGPQGDGSTIHEVYDCPDQAQIEDAAYLLASGRLEEGQYRHNFTDLSATRTSCCGNCGS